MWITGFFSTLMSSPHVYVCLLYLFSLLLPAIGLLLFMSSARENSTRWYWGVPLLIGLFLITFLRDNMAANFFYEWSFISTFDTFNLLETAPLRISIMIFFSLASVLFCLSADNGVRTKMRIPLMLSIISSLIVIIFFMDHLARGALANSSLYGIHVIVILFIGLSFLWLAIYDSME